jgi:hypothetical protein
MSESDAASSGGVSFRLGLSQLFIVPISQVANITALVHLISTGYNWNPVGAPAIVLKQYARFRDFMFNTLVEVFPQAVIPSAVQDLILLWLVTGCSIYSLYFHTNYPDLVKEIREFKEEQIVNGTPKIVEGETSVYRRFSDASYMLHYPWILKSFVVLLLLGPLIALILLYKVLFPSFLVDARESREKITRSLRRDTIIIWSWLFLTFIGTAATLWMDEISNLARSTQ